MLRRLLNALPVVPILRGPARGLLWVPETSSHGVWLGTYERENVQTLRSLVHEGMTVWDVGANVGAMTLILSRLVGPTGRVVAFEPGPRNAKALRRHVGSRRNVEVVEAAVSSSTGEAFFHGDGRSDARLSPTGPIPVRTVTLDSVLQDHQAPALVKLDVEGHEMPALIGAERLLQKVRPMLAVEFHGAGLPARDIDAEARTYVESFGYTWSSTSGGWFVAKPR